MTDDKEEVLYENGGFTITLTPRRCFRADGPEMRDGGFEFDTYEKALDKITKVNSSVTKRINRKLALPVLIVNDTSSHYGKTVTYKLDEAFLTGLHATQGVFLTKPKMDIGRWDRASVYPNVSCIRTLVNSKRAIEQALRDVKHQLEQFEINEVGYRIRDENYDSSLTDLETTYAERKAAAEKYETEKAKETVDA